MVDGRVDGAVRAADLRAGQCRSCPSPSPNALTASDHGELVDVATLLVSEVVTNSVLHAGTEIRLRCQLTQTGVRIEVFDRSPLLPSGRHYDPQATTGRGLKLVSALASSWGVRSEDDGKALWFELLRGEDRGEGSSSPEADTEPRGTADETLEGFIAQDERCIDAWVHLGNIAFDSKGPKAAVQLYDGPWPSASSPFPPLRRRAAVGPSHASRNQADPPGATLALRTRVQAGHRGRSQFADA